MLRSSRLLLIGIETAVASFFTPTSQKPKDRTIWTERSRNDNVPATLLVGRYAPEGTIDLKPRHKVAAFDLDSTLIATSSGKKHASGATDWKWWHSQVPGRLRQLCNDEGYRVIILSNQAGLTLHFDTNHKGPKATAQKRVSDFKQKCNAVLSNLDLPTSVYAATERDVFRKPNTGMWKELCEDYDIPGVVDLDNSFFVGDAGGRLASAESARDFSCSDRNLAENLGIRYHTPEEFFLGQEPREYSRDLDLALYPFTEVAEHEPRENAEKGRPVLDKITNQQVMLLFCGSPGAGKSTFYWKHAKPLGFERVNQDQLRSRDRCVQVASDFLDDGKSVAIGESIHMRHIAPGLMIRLAENPQTTPTPTRIYVPCGSN